MTTADLLQRVKWTRGFRCQTDKDVLTAMVRWFCFRADGTNIRPSTIQLAEKSQVPERTLDRALRRLEKGLFITATSRRRRHHTVYRVNLDRLATEDPERLKLASDRDAISARVAPIFRDERHSGAYSEKWRLKNAPDFDEVALQYRSEEEDLDPSSSPVPGRHSGAHSDASGDVADFLAWWTVTYPPANSGAQSHLTEADGVIVRKLLDDGFTYDDLQRMALYLWHVTTDGRVGSDRWWIATVVTDRNLRVLAHKATELDRWSRLGAPHATQLRLDSGPHLTDEDWREAAVIRARGCPHEATCTDDDACLLKIAYALKGYG